LISGFFSSAGSVGLELASALASSLGVNGNGESETLFLTVAKFWQYAIHWAIGLA